MFLGIKKIFCVILLGTAVILSGKNAAEPVKHHPRITILGSMGGIEPMPGRHHTAWILEYGDKIYQFDAGEGCAYAAHLSGIDLSQLRAIFISHPHIDHNAGLPHLIMVRNKMISLWKRKPAARPLPIYTPLPSQVEALQDFMSAAACHRADYRSNKNIKPFKVTDGVVFDDGTIKVEALHNTHCGMSEDKQWFSVSYKITAGGRKIVFSGDVRSIDEMSPLLEDCDLLLMENGHHKPWEIAAKIRKTPGWKIRRLLFLHHGRTYLNSPVETARKTCEAWGSPVEFAFESMKIEL